jgi:hypothetical protein
VLRVLRVRGVRGSCTPRTLSTLTDNFRT